MRLRSKNVYPYIRFSKKRTKKRCGIAVTSTPVKKTLKVPKVPVPTRMTPNQRVTYAHWLENKAAIDAQVKLAAKHGL